MELLRHGQRLSSALRRLLRSGTDSLHLNLVDVVVPSSAIACPHPGRPPTLPLQRAEARLSGARPPVSARVRLAPPQGPAPGLLYFFKRAKPMVSPDPAPRLALMGQPVLAQIFFSLTAI